MKKRSIFILLTILVLHMGMYAAALEPEASTGITQSGEAAGTQTREIRDPYPAYETYIYDYHGNVTLTPAACIPTAVYTVRDQEGEALSAPGDMVSLPGGGLAIADTGNNRVVFLDSSFQVTAVLSTFVHAGEEDRLSGPLGICVDENGHLYVADTRNSRVLEFDEGRNLVRVLEKPDTTLLPEGYTYSPIAVAVQSGHIYIVAEGINLGILHYMPDGSFTGFVGAKPATYSPIDYLWKSILSDEQSKRMMGFVPTEYNNITVDEAGFLYVTTSALEGDDIKAAVDSHTADRNASPLCKINYYGDDVLTRQGYFPPVGDVKAAKDEEGNWLFSLITDVAVGPNGQYTLLDIRNNRLFCYSAKGELLYAYSGEGTQTGQSVSPSSVIYMDKDILLLDGETGNITRFSLTEYGKLIDQALTRTAEFRYDEANRVWGEVIKTNVNFDIAYDALGENALRVQEYTKAMRYYQYSGNKAGYSEALKKNRADMAKDYLPLVLLAAAAILFLLVKALGYIGRRNTAQAYADGRGTFRSQSLYAFHVSHHPIDGYWDLIHERRGGMASATVFLLLMAVSSLARQKLVSYLFADGSDSGLIQPMLTILVPFLLFMVANWGVTSLMDGKGRMRDIYMLTGYACFPMIWLNLLQIPLSYLLILDESMYLSLVGSVAALWTGALIFFGNMVIHDYTVKKAAAAILLSIVGLGIILFVLLLIVTTYQDFFTFIGNIIQEIEYRLS